MTYKIEDFQKLKAFLLANNNPTSQILLMLLTIVFRKGSPVAIGEGFEPIKPSEALLNEYEPTIASINTSAKEFSRHGRGVFRF